MKKKKVLSPPSWREPLLRTPQALWGLLGLLAWSVQQVLHLHKGEAFSLLLFIKGCLLIGAAAYLFHRWQAKGFFFLGMFPLLWVAFSRAQWEICSPAHQAHWNWLVLFLISEVVISTVRDGRKLLFLLAPLWILQTHLFRFSLLLPLAFLRFPDPWLAPWRAWTGWLTNQDHLMISHWGKGAKAAALWVVWVLAWAAMLFGGASLVWWVPAALLPLSFLTSPNDPFRRREWAGWGGALGAVLLFLGHRAWTEFSFDWVPAWTFFVDERYLSFLLLGWLGLVSLPGKAALRYSCFAMFPLALGFQFWPGSPEEAGAAGSLLLWVLLLFAGNGWESFRVNLMDQSWHGRLVWFVLGLGLMAGLV